MAEESEKFTENENPPAETPEDMAASLSGLQDALASLTAVAGTVAAANAGAKKPPKKKRR